MNDSSSFEKSSDTLAQRSSPVNQDQGQGTVPSPPPLPADTSGIKTSKKQLVRAAGVVGLMTLTSRILGMIRDIVTAGKFGTTWHWDSFIYAFMLPNFFRRLVGEGALSSAFIPVYSETLQQKSKADAFRFANVIGTLLAFGLTIFMLVVELILHFLMKADFLSPRLHLTVDLLRIFFPYLFFISLFALAMGILNCHQHFFTPALGPVILDLAWIVGVLWVIPHAGKIPENQLRWLAVILLISGALQFAVDIPPLYKMGFRFKWTWDVAHEGLQKTFRLLLPAIMGFAIVQLNLLLDMVCGYFIGAGANSSLWYGTRLMQFPLGVFGIAMGTALLPTISHQVARKEHEAAKKTLSFAMRSIALIILPCTVGLIVLSTPIVQLLFERGKFDAVSTARTASVLTCYDIGLYSYAGEKIMAAGFFASQNTRIPVIMGIVSLTINAILNVILMRYFNESGLALATAVASIIELILLVNYYHKKISSLPISEIVWSFFRILGASLAMGVFCWACFQTFSHFYPDKKVWQMLIRVFGTISLSTIAYVVFCFVFRVPEIREAFDFLKRKKTLPQA